MRRVVLAVCTLLQCVAQQVPVGDTGVIVGTVSGEDGSSVVGAYVTLHLSFTAGQAVRQRLQTQWGVYSGPGGSFRFAGLRNGTYRLCVKAPATAWLGPCEWGLPIPSVVLTSTERSRTLAIPLRKGVEVPIRIDDPGQILFQHEGRTLGAHMLVGVRTPASTFLPAASTSREAIRRTLRIVIPFDKLVHLTVASSFFKLADGNGAPFATPGGAIPLAVPAGQAPATVRLLVTGRK